jgi:hypothetical protein
MLMLAMPLGQVIAAAAVNAGVPCLRWSWHAHHWCAADARSWRCGKSAFRSCRRIIHVWDRRAATHACGGALAAWDPSRSPARMSPQTTAFVNKLRVAVTAGLVGRRMP